MNKEIVVNSKYKDLEFFIKSIPENWENIGKSIYKGRNEIKVIDIDEFQINVKSYKVPHYLNRFAYAYLRHSKAKRTYFYAHKLQNLSIETPEPIAYINCYENGLLKHSFYISVQLSEYPITIRDVIGFDIENKELLLRQFIRFTYFSLLKNGVNHLDYSRGNILIDNEGYMHQFSIVDINRMRFEKMNTRRSLKMISRLWAGDEELDIIADEYAIITDQSREQIKNLLIYYDNHHKNKIEKKKKFKRKFQKIINKR